LIVEDYDIVLIGSGPIVLLEAMHLRKFGHSVVVLEQADRFGGAWQSVAVPGFGEVEIGCHIWDVAPEVHGFLEALLKVPLIPLQPQPRIYSGRVKVPYDWKNMVFMLREAMGSLKKGSFGGLGKAMRKGFKKGMNVLPQKYVYPTGGAHQFVQALLSYCEKHGVELRSNQCVSEVQQVGKNAFHVTTSTDTYRCKRVVLSSFGELNKIVLKDGTAIELEQGAQREWIHYHLHIKDQSKKSISYVRVVRDALIHRISDVTHQIEINETTDTKDRLYLVGVHASAFHKHTEEERLAQLLASLKSYKILGKEASLIGASHNIYKSRLLSQATRNQLEALNEEGIQCLYSVNLMHGMEQQLERWKSLLSTL